MTYAFRFGDWTPGHHLRIWRLIPSFCFFGNEPFLTSSKKWNQLTPVTQPFTYIYIYIYLEPKWGPHILEDLTHKMEGQHRKKEANYIELHFDLKTSWLGNYRMFQWWKYCSRVSFSHMSSTFFSRKKKIYIYIFPSQLLLYLIVWKQAFKKNYQG